MINTSDEYKMDLFNIMVSVMKQAIEVGGKHNKGIDEVLDDFISRAHFSLEKTKMELGMTDNEDDDYDDDDKYFHLDTQERIKLAGDLCKLSKINVKHIKHLAKKYDMDAKELGEFTFETYLDEIKNGIIEL